MLLDRWVAPMKTQPQPAALDFDKCLLLVRAVLGDPSNVTREFSIGITTTSGRHLVIDSRADPIVSQDDRRETALAIVTSEDTLSALLTGRLQTKSGGADPLFVWGGDLTQWTALVDAVSTFSTVSVRLKGAAR